MQNLLKLNLEMTCKTAVNDKRISNMILVAYLITTRFTKLLIIVTSFMIVINLRTDLKETLHNNTEELWFSENNHVPPPPWNSISILYCTYEKSIFNQIITTLEHSMKTCPIGVLSSSQNGQVEFFFKREHFSKCIMLNCTFFTYEF